MCAMHMRGAITSPDGGYSCSSLRSYYISMNWLEPESFRGGPSNLLQLIIFLVSLVAWNEHHRDLLPSEPVLHYEKSRSTGISVFMEIIDLVS
jgi:hypothetical protein